MAGWASEADERLEPSRLEKALRLGLVGLGISAFSLWIGYLWTQGFALEFWDKDWYCFYSAGQHFRELGPEGVYLTQCSENYFWLYPPYMLYPYALASLFSPLAVYLFVQLEIIVVLGVALKLLGDSLPRRGFGTLAAFVLGSAALFSTLVVGQHSALLLAGIAGAIWALQRERHVVAGLFLGILGIKPNLAAIFVLWLLVTRRWKTLGTMAAVGMVFILSTLPMGLGIWEEYITMTPRWIAVLLNAGDGEVALRYPAHKLITLEAFTRSTLGNVSPALGRLGWILLELIAAAACLVVWLRSRSTVDQVAITVLVAVAANIYVEFYDALLLAVPAAVWWTGRARYPALLWKISGAAAGGIWLWHWVLASGAAEENWPSLFGAFLATWVASEAVRALSDPGAPEWLHAGPPSAPE